MLWRAQWKKDLGAKQKVRVLLGERLRWQIGVSETEIWGAKGRSRGSLGIGLRWQVGLSRAEIWECKQMV